MMVHIFRSRGLRNACVGLFAVSVVFAILTLALIPHIAEDLKEEDRSIYRVRWDGWLGGQFQLMDFCLPQHTLFLLGIICYAGGTAFCGTNRCG
jgi:hypothetical protein